MNAACPDVATLRELIDGTLDGHSSATVATHVGGCSACQTALDALTAGSFHLFSSALDATPRPEFLDRLKREQVDGPARRAAERPTIPGYDILEELGRGGMGAVYKARHHALHRVVALKVLLGGGRAGAEELARFRTEALVTGRLGHPGVVQVFEVGEWTPSGGGPVPYVCLEFVGGGSLARKIARTPQPPAFAADTIRRVAEAVHAAHQQGVIHRDLKPDNVLLDLATGHPKVTDFGLAKEVELGSGHTHTGMILGTPSYMAPEQARGTRSVDARTDVYGLGAILYELLTGHPPFHGPTPLDTVVMVVESDPIPPRQVQPTVPRDLETICLKCLTKEPGRRYPTAKELAEDVERFLAGRPIVARPVGPVGRFAKWCRRNPVIAGLSVVLAVIVIGSLIGLTALYLEADRARKASDDAKDKTAAALKESDEERSKTAAALKDSRAATARMEKSNAGLRAVTEFFQRHVLAAPRPKGQGSGSEVTVEKAVDDAEGKIAGQFVGQPEVEAAIRNTLGVTYFSQARYEKARGQWERAVALWKTCRDPDDKELLATQTNLALANLRLFRYDEAEKLLRENLDTRIATLGPDNPDTMRSRNALGGFLHESGQFREAVEQLEQILAAYDRTPPADPTLVLLVQGNLATVLAHSGKHEEAEKLVRAVIDGRTTTQAPDHPEVINSRLILIDLLLKRGKVKEARPLADEVVKSSEKTFTADSPMMLPARLRQIQVLAETDMPAAIQDFRDLIARFDKIVPPDQSERLNSISGWAICLLDHHRPADAFPWADEALTRHRELLPKDHPLLATTLMLHAECLLAAGKAEDAEKEVREAIKIREAKLSPKHWFTASAKSLLGECLAKHGKFDDAKTLLIDSYEAMKKAEAPADRIAEARERIRKMFTDSGKPDEAKKW